MSHPHSLTKQVGMKSVPFNSVIEQVYLKAKLKMTYYSYKEDQTIALKD